MCLMGAGAEIAVFCWGKVPLREYRAAILATSVGAGAAAGLDLPCALGAPPLVTQSCCGDRQSHGLNVVALCWLRSCVGLRELGVLSVERT